MAVVSIPPLFFALLGTRNNANICFLFFPFLSCSFSLSGWPTCCCFVILITLCYHYLLSPLLGGGGGCYSLSAVLSHRPFRCADAMLMLSLPWCCLVKIPATCRFGEINGFLANHQQPLQTVSPSFPISRPEIDVPISDAKTTRVPTQKDGVRVASPGQASEGNFDSQSRNLQGGPVFSQQHRFMPLRSLCGMLGARRARLLEVQRLKTLGQEEGMGMQK